MAMRRTSWIDHRINDDAAMVLEAARIAGHCRLQFMTKAVFTTKVTPGYNDLPEVRYHFPRTYLNQARRAVGDHVVYYEPRRSSVELSSLGGRQCYFGVARVMAIVEDDTLADHYYALVDDYLDFDRPVPFSEGSEYYESALKKADGSTNKGAFGRAVRLIPDDEFDRILKSGFAPILGENPASQEVTLPGYSEPPVRLNVRSLNDCLSAFPGAVVHAQRARRLFK
jgi:putative restriction endonuclease